MIDKIPESEVEANIRKYAISTGWWVCKFTAPGKRGVPDRLFIRDGRHVFIEVKRAGETPTRQQLKRHAEMRQYGAEVFWVDSVEGARTVLR